MEDTRHEGPPSPARPSRAPRAAVDVAVKETPEQIGVSLKPRAGNPLELTSAFVEAAQVLVNRVVNPRAEGRKWVNLDVGGFREEGDPAVSTRSEGEGIFRQLLVVPAKKDG